MRNLLDDTLRAAFAQIAQNKADRERDADDFFLGADQPSIQITLKLYFEYQIEDPPLTHRVIESIALLLPPTARFEALEANLREALGSLGPEPSATSSEIALTGGQLPVGFANHDQATLVSASGGALSLGSMDDQPGVSQLIASLARQAGQRLSEATGAIGYRRAADISSHGSIVEAIEVGFEELEALYQALIVKSELDAVSGRGCSSAKPRPGL